MQNKKIMIHIIHDRSIDEEIMEMLKKLNLNNFTKYLDIQGVGENGPHLGDHIWPALNNVTMVVAGEDLLEPLLQGVKEVQQQFPFAGLRAIVTPVLAMV